MGNTEITEEYKEEIKISVRGLVEFILREGDIDNRFHAMVEGAMQEGSRIHRAIQKRMGADYQAEVPLRFEMDAEKYVFVLEGRADGIIDKDGDITIDEIKGTYRDLNKLRKPVAVHVAQAKCYAYMYGCQAPDVKEIRVRMTYVNMETEDIRYFYEEFTFEELEKWFQNLVNEYRKWADYSYTWQQIRQQSLNQLEFPFEYRDGQKDLVSNVYRTIYHQRKLFIEAPTGVGKTISTIFPSLKAMGKGIGERLFYLTAKTITRTVADDTFKLLRDKGLQFKSIILTAKEKTCFMEQTVCNPEACPYAKGHFDRVNEAMYDMVTHEDSFDRETLEAYARKHEVCPFEFALDMSLYADGIICDYNYLFDPHVYLKRFFAEGGKGNYLFLVDEAHNLLERGREMYSAELNKERVLEVKRELKQFLTEERAKLDDEEYIEPEVDDGQLTFDMTSGLTEVSKSVSKARKIRKKKKSNLKIINDGYGDRIVYHLEQVNQELLDLKRQGVGTRVNISIEELAVRVEKLYGVLSEYMEENEDEKLDIREVLLDFYFDIGHFLLIYDKRDDHYVTYSCLGEDGSFVVNLFCVNPRENLKECMARGLSTILFSATLLPIQYYKELLGGDETDYEVYAKSVFSTEKRGLYFAGDVTTKYDRRTPEEFQRMAAYIHEIVSRRQGNYMVFCPSYSFMKQVLESYEFLYKEDGVECLVQKEVMTEEAREDFISRFRGNEQLDFEGFLDFEVEEEDEIHTLVGFCVMGGIFGEGIDLKNDSLIGAIIIGTGLPQVCEEREIIKNYFDNRGENGFDYAYRYPGMNKVLQAAGRVIRTSEDIGVIALLDERFMQAANRRMFPREWEEHEQVTVQTIGGQVERFWDSWGKY